jgi:hypothetical protein
MDLGYSMKTSINLVETVWQCGGLNSNRIDASEHGCTRFYDEEFRYESQR